MTFSESFDVKKEHKSNIRRVAARIVSSYVSHHQLSADMLPSLIEYIVKSLEAGVEPAEIVDERPRPAVPIKHSVHADYIVCLEDGVHLKMMKRYLQRRYGLTPEQYRERWGLGRDYPMVAPGYAERRSAIAVTIGLGRKRLAP